MQTYRPPVSEYKVVRQKASAEHRDIERALTRFIAKTGDTENLFPDDPYAFPCTFSLAVVRLIFFVVILLSGLDALAFHHRTGSGQRSQPLRLLSRTVLPPAGPLHVLNN